MSTSGDVEPAVNSSPESAPASAAGSPRSKVKFLCSHGGKILPRPVDGHLKYVGGETRVISVLRSITFADLMKKLNSLIEGDVTLKYQFIPEELDALVTVKSDEDLRHMFDEHDRHELVGTPRLRTFLFPSTPIIIEHQIGSMDRYSLEQRYINSINGIVVNPTPIYNRNFRINTSQSSFSISSACSSPRTPPETAVPMMIPDVTNREITGFRKVSAIPRARSSPSLFNLGVSSSMNNHKNPTHTSTLNLNLTNQQYPYHHQHRQPQPIPKPPHKNYGPDHFTRVRATGLADYWRHPTDHNQYTPNPSRNGYMVYPKGSPNDEFYVSNRYDQESSPGSR